MDPVKVRPFVFLMMAFMMVSTLLAHAAQAQTSYRPASPLPMMQPAVPSTMTRDDVYFDMSSTGMDELLNFLQAKDPSAYQAIKPEVETIRAKQLTATAMFWGGMLAIVASPFMVSGGVSQEDDGSLDRDKLKKKTTTAVVTALGGVALAGGSLFVYPSRADYLRVINKHNEANPSSPLKINLGFAPRSDSTGEFAAVLAWSL
jgi:hypothetical protein